MALSRRAMALRKWSNAIEAGSEQSVAGGIAGGITAGAKAMAKCKLRSAENFQWFKALK